ncbi:hypothetical protein SHIRM173S_08901 [Streptomyces hirsutus]
MPPAWRGSLLLPRRGPRTLDVAARHLPSATGAATGGEWYDALELSDGATLLGVGELTGQGVGMASGMAMLIGAMRGMAMSGTEPGPLMACLNRLLDATGQPALGSGLCLRYRPETRSLVWAQAGHPSPCCSAAGRGTHWTFRTASCWAPPRLPPTGRPRRPSKPATCCCCTPTGWCPDGPEPHPPTDWSAWPRSSRKAVPRRNVCWPSWGVR